MRLDRLLEGMPVTMQSGAGDVGIWMVADDSRAVRSGGLFIARGGSARDGSAFLADARERGAVAALVPRDATADAFGDGVVVRCDDPGALVAAIADRFHGNACATLPTVGVTGTNGKTTIAYLVHQLLAAGGKRAGLIGTVEIDDGRRREPSTLTTPGAVELSELFARMLDHGCVAVAMEASSHALDQGRVDRVRFEVGIFTNLTGDHLDYHGTMERYAEAKARLFARLPASGTAVLNRDDPWWTSMAKGPARRLTCTAKGDPEAECAVAVGEVRLESMRCRFRGPWGEFAIDLPLVGRHNAMNALQAAAAAWSLGVPVEALREGLERCSAPPGRLQPVRAERDGSGFSVLVDYAHTDDALLNVLTALRPVVPEGGALRVVFGCGGDRDRTKRPRMARVACEHADDVVVTSDNPRTEDPQSIIADILAGVPEGSRGKVAVEPDRSAAIALAVRKARRGDVVLIAGKGHEDYQIVGTEKRRFDDRAEAEGALRNRLAEVKPMSGSRPAFLSLAEMVAATGARLAAGPANVPLVGVGTDTRADLAGRLFVALRGERHDAHDHLAAAVAAGAGALLVERVPDAVAIGEVPTLVVPDTRKALATLAKAWRSRLALARCVAITGSSGKTTTRRLVEAILGRRWQGTASPKSFNNDLGVPLTLLSARPDDRFLAIEIGMNHPGEIRPLADLAAPEVAIVTMVGRAHLEGLGSLEAIATEKASILAPLPENGLGIVNGDRAELLAAVERLGPRARVLRFGRGPGNDLRLTGRWAATPAEVLAGAPAQRIETSDGLVADLALPGEHNAVNALAAIAAARHLGFTDAEIAAGLPTVRPEAMRLERIEVGGIGFLNDAYNANPDAMIASLATFAELAADAPRRIAILGDMLELGAASEALHEEVGRAAGSLPALHRIEAVGRFAPATLRGIASAGFRGEARLHAALGEPELAAILDGLRPGDAVLLKGSRGSAMERVLAAARDRPLANPDALGR